MATEIKVPPFPESVEEGTLTTWHKQVGDAVGQDEKIADIETDKIVLEVMATDPGVLKEVLVNEGAPVKPGQVLGRIEAGASAPAAGKKEKAAKVSEPAPERTVAASVKPAESGRRVDAAPSLDGAKRLSPVVRRLVEEEGIDPTQLQGTGRGGVVTKADVLAHLKQASSAASPVPAAGLAVEVGEVATSPMPVSPPVDRPMVSDDGRPVQRAPMSRLRARIAERLVQAQQTAAILTTFNEVNLQAVMDWRARHAEEFEKKHGVKLGFMSFFAKACVEAFHEFPVVNAALDGTDIVYHGYVDMGMAVSTERGLVVPVLRDVDQLSFAAIEKGIVELAGRARSGKLEMEELTGGTFTITNGGVFGSLLSTPILNPPQSAILGMHTIQQRPVAEQGQVVIRPMMYLALSYDHRIIDGREAVQFLVSVKKNLEDPARLLLQL